MRRMIPYNVDITGNFVYSPQLIEARKQVQEELLNVAQLLEIENKENPTHCRHMQTDRFKMRYRWGL